MRYVALLYWAEDRHPAPTSPEYPDLVAAYLAATSGMKDAGVFVAADPLDRVATATSVQVRGGKTIVTDGPFAETKERLGGYYLMDCDTLEEAIAHASTIPALRYGTIEVRALRTP